MKNYASIGLVILLFTASCGPKINEKQQESLNELTLKVDSSLAILTAIDSAEMMQMGSDFEQMKFFLLNDIKDTLSPATVFYLDSFLNLKKPMAFITSKYSPLKQEGLIIQQQMKDLKQDVENRLVDEEQFEKYYTLEKENYSKLHEAVGQFNNAYNVSRRRYTNMKPKIDSIISASKSSTFD